MDTPTPPSMPTTRLAQAQAALAASRAALRNELVPPPAPPGPARGGLGLNWRRWWRRVQTWPLGRALGGGVGRALQSWWQRHPLQPLGDAVIGEASGTLLPLARRHPWAVVGTAAVVGAGLVALKPWRWSWLDRRVRRLPTLASGWVLAQLSSAPVQAMVASALAGMVSTASSTASTDAAGEDRTDSATPTAPRATDSATASAPTA